jgi:autotransporter-associated beta strand protein
MLAATLTILIVSDGWAATDYWTGNSAVNGNWATTGNWSTGAKPGNTDTAQFDAGFTGSQQPNMAAIATVGGLYLAGGLGKNVTIGGASILTVNGATLNGNANCGILLDSGINRSLTVTAPVTLGASQIWINNQAAGSGYGLTTSGNVATAAGKSLSLGGSGDITINGIISSAGDLIKLGPGLLTLSATNTYTGATILSNGTLRLTHAACLSLGTTVWIWSGATNNLAFTGTNAITALYIDGVPVISGVYGASQWPTKFSGTGYLFPSQPTPSVGGSYDGWGSQAMAEYASLAATSAGGSVILIR